MYREFYNLEEKPFDLNHSSRYLYLGEAHKEALAMLTYGVIERKGFVLLTGEVGTGKTTIIHALLGELDKRVQVVYLANPALSPKEFMDYLTFSVFRNRIAFKSKAEFLLAFEAFLNQSSQQQRTFLLIIDEAHKLSFDVLEEIRLLSNMETAEEKLINIFLVGQPELNKRLGKPACRALLQRIGIRHHIKPLTERETDEYMIRRLKVAGASKADDIFSRSVRKAIYEYSRGYPRVINILSDNLLLLGYARGVRRLTPSMVRECFEELRPEYASSAEDREPETVRTGKKPETHESYTTGFRKWALIGALAIVLFAVSFHFAEEMKTKVMTLVTGFSAPAQEKSQAGSQVPSTPTDPRRSQRKSPPDIEKATIPAAGEAEKKTKASTIPGGEGLLESEKKSAPEVAERIESLAKPGGTVVAKTIIAQDGDTLDKLAMKVYGRSDEGIWEMIQEHNPDIQHVDLIRRGQKIVFPPLEGSGP
jgi:type II secretory pathway predicted ATPase ExeA/phage tail protein X